MVPSSVSQAIHRARYHPGDRATQALLLCGRRTAPTPVVRLCQGYPRQRLPRSPAQGPVYGAQPGQAPTYGCGTQPDQAPTYGYGERLAKGQHAAHKHAGTAERHPLRRNGFLRSPSLLSRLAERPLDRAIPAAEHRMGESSPVGAGRTHTLSVPTGRRGARGRRPRRRGSPRTRRRYRGQLSQLSERPAPPP